MRQYGEIGFSSSGTWTGFLSECIFSSERNGTAFHVRSSLMLTPRYFLQSTVSSTCPRNPYEVFFLRRLLVQTLIIVHFSGWKYICHFVSKSSREGGSVWRSKESFPWLMWWYKRQSSAKSLPSDVFTTSGGCNLWRQDTVVGPILFSGELRRGFLSVMISDLPGWPAVIFHWGLFDPWQGASLDSVVF